MKSIKGTKTEQNLLKAFANESMAHLRYGLFEEQAKKEGFKEAAAFFKEAKEEERGHAKLWFELLNGGELADTASNIAQAIENENDEWTDSYEKMAEDAQAEGFAEIAAHFKEVASEEEGHEGELHKLVEAASAPKRKCCKKCK